MLNVFSAYVLFFSLLALLVDAADSLKNGWRHRKSASTHQVDLGPSCINSIPKAHVQARLGFKSQSRRGILPWYLRVNRQMSTNNNLEKETRSRVATIQFAQKVVNTETDYCKMRHHDRIPHREQHTKSHTHLVQRDPTKTCDWIRDIVCYNMYAIHTCVYSRKWKVGGKSKVGPRTQKIRRKLL